MTSGGGKLSSRHLRDPSPKRLGHPPFFGVYLPTNKGKTVPRNDPGKSKRVLFAILLNALLDIKNGIQKVDMSEYSEAFFYVLRFQMCIEYIQL
jgi:hypothetical protein